MNSTINLSKNTELLSLTHESSKFALMTNKKYKEFTNEPVIRKL